MNNPGDPAPVDKRAGKIVLQQRVQSPHQKNQKLRGTLRALVLLLGLILPQVVLYGPSLLGRKVLLPLDVLTIPRVYLPAGQLSNPPPPWNLSLQDPVLQIEIFRRYAVQEIRAGRFPLWNPLNYCGAPFLAANQSAVLSPYRLLDYLFPGTLIIAWGEVVRVIVAGLGAYLFFRRVLRVGFMPAAIGAWCWPLTGVFVLWMSFPVSHVATWLGWMLLATDSTIRRPWGWRPVGLALVTALALLSGHAATAGHVLIASGIYAIGLLIAWPHRRRLVCFIAVVLGWATGIGLSAPQTLPTIAYLQNSIRASERAAGQVETAPIGISAGAQLAMPYLDGATTRNTIYLLPGNRLEGAPCGAAGIVFVLLLAPLGFANRRSRRFELIWVALAIVATAQVLNTPLLANLLDSPPLSLLRNNRMVFLFAWAAIASGVAGLDQVRRRGMGKWLPLLLVAILLGIGGWCVRQGSHLPRVVLIESESVRGWFTGMFGAYAGMCAMTAILAGALVFMRRSGRAGWCWAAGLLAIVELTITAWGVNPQCDPSLYYPPLPLLTAITHMPRGRICGVQCLPANLNQVYGLPDPRGYDAADPARIVELMDWFRYAGTKAGYSYARVQWWVPSYPSALADLLDLRYLIVTAGAQDPRGMAGYRLVENPSALPRATIPQRVETINSKSDARARLTDPQFRPERVAYVESKQPIAFDHVAGSASIVQDLPSRVTVSVDMQTPGLLLLADSWNPGWKATYNGQPVPVLPADHALRGVVVPRGRGTVVFTYSPASFTWGLIIAAICALISVAWIVLRRNMFTRTDAASAR